jgi:HEAT repeat protein
VAELDKLLAILDGTDHWSRVEAIGDLRELGDRAAIPALIEVLEDEQHECWHTQTEAITALVALGATESAPALIAALTRARDPDTRIHAAEALATLRIAQAHVALRMIATRERDSDVGRAARKALDDLVK